MQFINNLRGIAILLVLFVHAISTFNSYNSTLIVLISRLFDNCTILFVMMAGYLFSYQAHNFSYKRFMHGKVNSVVIPYIVISLPAILLYLFGLKPTHYWIDMEWFTEQSVVFKYFYLMFTGAHLGPLWFIPMIILIYLVSPIFIYLKEKNSLKFLFFISIVLGFIVGRPEENDNIIASFLYFLPAYLLGYYLSYNTWVYTRFSSKSVFIFNFILIAYLIISYIKPLSSSSDLIAKMILAVIFFSFSYSFLNKKNKILDMFARLSFFIFFIHGYFSGALRILNIKYNLAFNNYEFLYLLLMFSLIVILSLSTFVILKLCLKSKSKKWVGI